jgi:major vault protein
MPSDGTRHERDLILAPNEYAYILDETKGNVINYVGPAKTSLANTDQPVVFNGRNKRFERCTLEQATQLFAIAPEGWYIVLKNPAQDGKPPKIGAANNLPELNIGRKVNIPGPVSFALWPGQMARILQGHRLRSNQYLTVRVYDEEAARANWGQAVIKPQTAAADSGAPESAAETDNLDLTMGKLLVIKGTEVSFYIPPTGVEVVPDESENYVRPAVTLERLEYCILLDEDGNKRYIIGPAVVFPRPTENFVERNGSRKFRAIELNEISGLYIKVIAPYDEGGQHYGVGDELFITGRDQMIYFPRPEHAIIRYGEQEVNFAVAIPAGEARYVLDRLTGQIALQRGPAMFLADPRRQVIVRRVLEPKVVELWFPGNREAFEYNQRLLAATRREKGEEFVSDQDARLALQSAAQPAGKAKEAQAATEEFAGDEFTRRQSFTPPRTITLDTKYEGAVSINVWTGYAVLVVSKTGERKVVVGPQTVLLEYDEILEKLELSTGTPKTDQTLMKTVYLRVLYNKVSDIVEAETSDFCSVRVRLSYRVNFEGAPEKWFDVENYVKFLTDHMRSLLRHAIRLHGIEDFYANAINIIRDTILGTAVEGGKRPGRLFEENGMRIYDVEVLGVVIGDEAIAGLLVDAQHSAVQQALELASEARELEATRQKESVKQETARAQAATRQTLLDLDTADVQKRLELNLAQIKAETDAARRKLDARWAEQALLDKIGAAELARQRAALDQELAVAQQRLAQRLEERRAEVEAVVSKAGAVSPQLVAALQAFSDRALAERMAESMAPLAILGGKSVAEVLAQLLKGTVLEKALSQTE